MQKHLSSSLIDVDVHPTYISVVIKSKVLRLTLPAEVKSQESVAQRSTTTGHLLVTMPKCNLEENILASVSRNLKTTAISDNSKAIQNRRSGLNQDMFKAASKPLVGSVCIDGLIVGRCSKDQSKKIVNRLDMAEVCTVRISSGDKSIEVCTSDSSSDGDEPPLPF